jgi:hypothetical protein
MSKPELIMRDHQKANRVLSAIKLKQETYTCFDRHQCRMGTAVGSMGMGGY